LRNVLPDDHLFEAMLPLRFYLGSHMLGLQQMYGVVVLLIREFLACIFSAIHA
jgi:hypothetical protein